MDDVLVMEHLAVAIGRLPALMDVSLTVRRGERVGLVGETGSGKSLTSRVIAGTLGRVGATITGGRAEVNGRNLAKLSKRDWRQLRRSSVGFVPQASMSGLDPLQTVRAHFREAFKCSGEDRGLPDMFELLTAVRLSRVSDVLASYPHQLSGGMRQRVMIALALTGGPDLIVADEPTTALDVTIQRDILEMISGLVSSLSVSLLLISHDMGVISNTTDSLAVMYSGMIVENGPTAQVLREPRHPYTRALVGATPSAASRGELLASIGGLPPQLDRRPAGCPFGPRCEMHVALCDVARPALLPVDGGASVACIRTEGQ